MKNKELLIIKLGKELSDIKREYNESKKNMRSACRVICENRIKMQENLFADILNYSFTEEELEAIICCENFFQSCWEYFIINEFGAENAIKHATRKALNSIYQNPEEDVEIA